MTEHTTLATQQASDELAEAGETAPSGELQAPAPELFERAREAVAALRGQGRLANGQAGPGNLCTAGYVKTVYRKLEVSSRAEATREAMRMGMIDS